MAAVAAVEMLHRPCWLAALLLPALPWALAWALAWVVALALALAVALAVALEVAFPVSQEAAQLLSAMLAWSDQRQEMVVAILGAVAAYTQEWQVLPEALAKLAELVCRVD